MKRLSLSTAALSLALLTAPAIFASLPDDAAKAAAAAAAAQAAIVTAIETGVKCSNQEAAELVRAHNLVDLAKAKLLAPRLAAGVEAKRLDLADTVAVRREVVVVDNAFALADTNKAKGLTPELALTVEDKAIAANLDLRDANKAKEATDLINTVLNVQKGWLGKSWAWSVNKVTHHWIISTAVAVTALAAVAGGVYWKLSQRKTVKPKPTPKNRSVTPVA